MSKIEQQTNENLIAFQRFVCNIVFGIVVVLCGIFLLFCGIGIIPLDVTTIALPCVLIGFGVFFVATAFIQKNSVSLWMSVFFIQSATVILLVRYVDGLNYSKMYPFFVLMPAMASIFTMFISKEYRIHFFTFGFFSIITLLLCLNSFGILGWRIVLPCILIFVGSLILFFSLQKRKSLTRLDDDSQPDNFVI